MTSNTPLPFQWFTANPQPAEIETGLPGHRKKKTLHAAYLVRHDGNDSKYLTFPGLARDLVVKISDLRSRMGDTEESRLLLAIDLHHNWIQCPIWDQSGNPVSQDVGKQFKNSPLIKCLDAGLGLNISDPNFNCGVLSANRNFNRYANLWLTYYTDAIKIAATHLAGPNPLGAYDVLDRFFVPRQKIEEKHPTARMKNTKGKGAAPVQWRVPSFKLWLVPLRCGPVGNNEFDGLLNYGVDPVWIGTEEEAKQLNLRCLSINPLQLYSTWVEGTTYAAIQEAQGAKDGNWERNPPTPEEVKAFNDRLLSKVPWQQCKVNAVHWDIKVSLPRWQGEWLSRSKRRGTKTYMGESANAWACKTLNWGKEKGGQVYAEWLHRIAHRFEQGTADRYSNMIFGSKECNTDMMRAEAAVTQLLKSKKIHQLLITTSSVCGYQVDVLNYARWATDQLKYTITYQTNEAQRQTHSFDVFFLPFSCQHPFRFEYELDKKLLERHLNQLVVPTFPYLNPGPDLLAGYHIKNYSSTEEDPADDWSVTDFGDLSDRFLEDDEDETDEQDHSNPIPMSKRSKHIRRPDPKSNSSKSKGKKKVLDNKALTRS